MFGDTAAATIIYFVTKYDCCQSMKIIVQNATHCHNNITKHFECVSDQYTNIASSCDIRF